MANRGSRRVVRAAAVALAALAGGAGQDAFAHSHSHHGHHGHRPPIPLGFGNGFGWYGAPFYMTIGPSGPVVITPAWVTPAPVVVVDRGLVGGPVPAFAPVARPAAAARAVKRPDPAKSRELVTIGDRLFRAGNHVRAAERYDQAARADPDSAAPRVRQAQVALVRGRFAEAAARYREATAVEPGWLTNAPNIQAIFAEPADFQRQIARLESRVLVEPGDRDAWLVLGAELFLSGQTRRAGDVFLRLTDRKPDPALAAFLDASGAGQKAQE